MVFFTAGIFFVFLGLATRRYPAFFPPFVAEFGGDFLWAIVVYCVLGFLLPLWSPRRLAILSFAVSYLGEISQLYEPPWLVAIRRTALGGLLLGRGFLWSDMVCYSLGTATAVIFRLLFSLHRPTSEILEEERPLP